MKTVKSWFAKSREDLKSRSAKAGSYSAVLTVIVLAVLIAVNVLFSALPETVTRFDISSSRLYSLTSSTKSVVTNLDKDVTIYWITQSGKEDGITEKVLDLYSALSSHVSVVKKNPDVYPTFASQYTDGTVNNNSLVVECGSRYRYIDYYDIYEQDTSDYYTTGSVSTYYDGEGELTAAIDYVVSDDLPQLYVLTGHGELELSTAVRSSFEKENIELKDFSLLNVDEVPEDADCVLIYAPEADISDIELDTLNAYLARGGKLMVFSGPQEEETFPNLRSILSAYGIVPADGIVLDANRNNYASYPYMLLPDIQSSDITDELIDNRSYIIAYLSQGFSLESAGSGVTSLLNTSEDSFSKLAGFDMQSFDLEDGDSAGPFSVAVLIDDSHSGAGIVWVGTDAFLDDTFVSYSAGANTDFALNALSELIGETSAISIRSKSLDYNYLTISSLQSTMIKFVLIAAIPIMYLAFGIDERIRRRKLK